MKAPLSASHFAVALLSLTPAVSALAWPRWLPDVDTLVVRQDDGSSQEESPSPTPTPKPTSSAADENEEETNESETQESSSTTGGPMKPIKTNLNTGGITQTGKTTGTVRATGNGTTTRAPKKTEFDPQDPAGGVVMVTPAITAGSQLYKIGDYVTWGWNYTNLQGSPTAIDLYVKCSKVPQPWTLTQNMSFTDPGTYTWDTHEFQKTHVGNPLLTEQYTLVIADADGGISATPEPGYLQPFSGLQFGLYEKQEYHDTGDGWQCASCSGAMSGTVDNRAVGVAVVMSAVTVLSFTWFVSGFGAFL